jgi:diguanylate cyclase (GGDEF)-like protein
MQQAPTPKNEAERFLALQTFGILDTSPGADFDALVHFLASACGTPIAAISLVDGDRQWFKASVGLTFQETPRNISFCGHAIAQADKPFVVSDAREDKRFAGNPLVTGDPHIRFYAGVPIVSEEGHALGAVCVMDRVPRGLTELQLDALAVAARLIMTLIEHDATTRVLAQTQKAKQVIENEQRATVLYLNRVEDERLRVANELQAEMSRRLHANHELDYSTTHDALTTLPNRREFLRMLEAAAASIRTGSPQHRTFAVYVIDIDHCKQINDSLGNDVGDNLLVQCGERLLDVAGVEDLVARIDSDAFALITFGTSTVKTAKLIARRIQASFAAPWHLAHIDCVVTASIGIVIADERYSCAEDIFRDANIALDHSKQHGRDRYTFFKSSFGTEHKSKSDLQRTLALALSNREFRLAYQPIVSLASGAHEVEGFEALMRWQRSDGIAVSPAAFIPAAEESGLIVPLGTWALKTACLALREWQRDAGPTRMPVRMSVNVSAIQLAASHFSSVVRDIIRETDIDPCALVIEVTESAAMLDAQRSLTVLRELRDLGIGIHVDDFGTGYSSLSYLRRLPVTCVKIDRSFVSADGCDELVDPVIVGAIVSLAHQLNLKVIAEGVETSTQLNTLRNLGCDSVQGYFISRPIPACDAAVFMKKPED